MHRSASDETLVRHRSIASEPRSRHCHRAPWIRCGRACDAQPKAGLPKQRHPGESTDMPLGFQQDAKLRQIVLQFPRLSWQAESALLLKINQTQRRQAEQYLAHCRGGTIIVAAQFFGLKSLPRHKFSIHQPIAHLVVNRKDAGHGFTCCKK